MAQTKNAKGKVDYKFNPKLVTNRQVNAIAKREDQVRELNTERQVAKFVVQGLSYDQIGQKLGISTQEAFQASREVVRKWTSELTMTATEIREIEVKRLDALQAMLTQTAFPHQMLGKETGLPILDAEGDPLMTAPDLSAVKLLLDVADRRAKLLGLDAADKLKAQTLDRMTRRYIGADPDDL